MRDDKEELDFESPEDHAKQRPQIRAAWEQQVIRCREEAIRDRERLVQERAAAANRPVDHTDVSDRTPRDLLRIFPQGYYVDAQGLVWGIVTPQTEKKYRNTATINVGSTPLHITL